MKKYLLFLLAAILPALRIGAQQPPGVACQEWQVVAGDTIPHVRIRPVWVFARGADLRRYRKLVAAVKKVYPVAKIARARMTEMEAELQRLPTKKAQKAYIRGVYRQIKEEYTPVVKHMTRTQGKVLLKLIDRLPFDEQPSTAPPCRPCRTTGLCARPLLYIIHSLNYIL